MKRFFYFLGCICFLQMAYPSYGQTTASKSTIANASTKTIIVANINIIDVEHNKTIPNQYIVIKGDRIVEVGSKTISNKYKNPELINGTGKFIMPSLWDMHVHFGGDTLRVENKMLLPLYIAMGISHVRDCAGDISDDVLDWKKQINDGNLLGPTIYSSGPKLEGINSIWPGDLEIGNEIALQKALDSLQKLKVDFVKITDNTLAPDLFLKSIIAAKKRGWKVTGHAPATITIETLSKNGLSAIEHIGYLTRSASKDEEVITQLRADNKISSKEASERFLQSFDSVIAVKKFKQLAMNGTAVVPTINGSFITTYLDKTNHDQDDYLKYLGPALKRTYNWRIQRAANDNAEAIEFRHRNFEAGAKLLPLLYASGVTILAGTDAGYLNSFNYPGLGMHQELAIMVKYGLTPQQALLCSIVNGPAFFNESKDYGAVAKNKKSELLLLNANPLTNIHNTESIFGLIRQGKYMNREMLDALLTETAKKVSSLK
jgi:imidazolonepropionase-like amidohydrolase